VSSTQNEHWFSRVASESATNTGRPWAFGLAAAFVVDLRLFGYLAIGHEYRQQHRDLFDGVFDSKCAKQGQRRTAIEAGRADQDHTISKGPCRN